MSHARVIFAGTSSGSGKTAAVCAVLSLLKRRGIKARSCKCGPDYIDPMFHRSVLGIPSSNLDPFFCDTDLLRYLSQNCGEDTVTVIEGVMGYYDGTGEDGTDNSTYTVASKTETPVILIVNAKGAAVSLLAAVEGFLNYRSDSNIAGVLFSRMSPMNYKNVSGLMKKRFGDRIVPVGYIPELPEECLIPSRHLGLITADEIDDLSQRLGKAADLCEGTIDIDAVLKIAGQADDPDFKTPEIPKLPGIKLAVAKDDAFCFSYDDTEALLRKMGAQLEYFSPLADQPVPEGADGLLLPGGYPELHAEELERNGISKQSVRAAIESGMPTIAECGGFQYLGEKLAGRRMCGVLPHESFDTGKLVRFGYATITANESGLLGEKGTRIRIHEFHYWDSTENGSAFHAEKPSGRSWECGVMTDTLYAGYPHLYLMSCIPAAEAFYRKCIEYKKTRRRTDDH